MNLTELKAYADELRRWLAADKGANPQGRADRERDLAATEWRIAAMEGATIPLRSAEIPCCTCGEPSNPIYDGMYSWEDDSPAFTCDACEAEANRERNSARGI